MFASFKKLQRISPIQSLLIVPGFANFACSTPSVKIFQMKFKKSLQSHRKRILIIIYHIQPIKGTYSYMRTLST